MNTLSVAVTVSEDTGVVQTHQHERSVTTVEEKLPMEGVKRLRLSDEEKKSIMDVGFQHMVLSLYRNQLLHWFVPEAMLALTLSHSNHSDTELGKLLCSFDPSLVSHISFLL